MSNPGYLQMDLKDNKTGSFKKKLFGHHQSFINLKKNDLMKEGLKGSFNSFIKLAQNEGINKSFTKSQQIHNSHFHSNVTQIPQKVQISEM